MHIILDFDPDLGFSRDQELAMALNTDAAPTIKQIQIKHGILIVWKSESFEYNCIA